MFEKEFKKYKALNQLATLSGTVIFGSHEDSVIPLGELKQAFNLETNLYNRSSSNLSINDAILFYDTCVAQLHPERVLLHIGETDVKAFLADTTTFDNKYRELIEHIKKCDKKCDVVVISLKNYEQDADIATMNKHLKYIAQSEHCEYVDISDKRLWNPKQTQEVSSFLFSTGFVRPLHVKKPAYDLVRILFCNDVSYAV